MNQTNPFHPLQRRHVPEEVAIDERGEEEDREAAAAGEAGGQGSEEAAERRQRVQAKGAPPRKNQAVSCSLHIKIFGI